MPKQETQKTQIQYLSWEDPLQEEMATCSRFLAWKSPWSEKPGGLQSMGSQRAGHDEQLSMNELCWKHFASIRYNDKQGLIPVVRKHHVSENRVHSQCYELNCVPLKT